MKLAFFIGLALAMTAAGFAIKTTHAAEPVDAFVIPVPGNPGTSAAILPPGTYHAVQSNGVRLSGWVHSPDASRFPMLNRAPSTPPNLTMPQRDPQLRFVPVQPQFPTLLRPGK